MTSTSPQPLEASARTKVRRKAERGSYERETIDAILDEGLLCHVGLTDEGTTYVLPMAYARVGEFLYLHGAAGNQLLRTLAAGVEACVSVTLFDGLVLARSTFHHSMNYRSVVLFAKGTRIDDAEEKLAALAAIVEHLVPGRSNDARPPNAVELSSTLVIRLPIVEASAKIRTGPPIEDAEDLSLEIWSGVIPFQLLPGEAIRAETVIPGVAVPPYVAEYPKRSSIAP